MNVVSRGEFDHNGIPARAWADVDLVAIEHNVRAIRDCVKPARVMAVVKADGYGHGSVRVARACLSSGAERLAVATLREADLLRRSGIQAPVQVLGVILDGSEEALMDLGGVCATVSGNDEIDRLSAAARRRNLRITVHLKVDTGMHRLGAALEDAGEIARRLSIDPGINFEGVMTHLATAGSDDDYAQRQASRFNEFVEWMRAEGICPPIVHAANSAGLFLYPETRWDMVRPGLAVFGITDSEQAARELNLRPAMRLCARVVNVRKIRAGEPVGYNRTWTAQRDSVIATASIGYADGLRTSMSNRGHALLRGCRVPVVGRVSMDFTALDVTGHKDVAAGEEVVFFGRQGEEEISVIEAARSMDAIPYELICGVSFRVWRVTQ